MQNSEERLAQIRLFFLVVKTIEKSMFKLWEKERCRMGHCCPFLAERETLA